MYLIVDNNYKINIWWSAKCACTYIKNMYYNEILKKNITNVHIPESYSSIYTKNSDYKNYYVCRNPYARIVSAYVHRLQLHNDYDSFEDFVNILYKHYVIKNITIQNKDLLHHTSPQFADKYPINDKTFKFTSVTKMEDLDKINLLKEWFGITTKIELKKDFGYNTNVQSNTTKIDNIYKMSKNDIITLKSQKKIPHYSSFYNHDIKRKVYDIYKTDFNMLSTYGIFYDIEKIDLSSR